MPDGRQQAIIDTQHRVFTPNYNPSLVLERGEGVWVWDADGNRYLDLFSGIAVNSFGHCHPRVVAAVQHQVAKLAHVSNVYANEPAVRLGERLVERTGFDRVYLCNSGTEAVEAALKLSRLHARKVKKEDRFEFVAFDDSFHGRTYGSISCTGQPKYHDGFEPLLPGVRHVPYGDLDAVRAVLGPKTAAVIIEPIQGEGGVRPAPAGFLAGLREACDAAGCLLILDEIQCGVGRTGRFFGHEHDGIRPDLVTLAKALGAGLPLGALLARADVGDAMKPGTHATTFGGNPVACAAGLAGLDVLEELGDRVRTTGELLRDRLEELVARHECALEVRGRGLLLGLLLDREAKPLLSPGLARGVIYGSAGTHVLRLAPPLILEPEHVDVAFSALDEVLAEAASASPREG